MLFRLFWRQAEGEAIHRASETSPASIKNMSRQGVRYGVLTMQGARRKVGAWRVSRASSGRESAAT